MMWLCDEMLARLARLLRAAGEDTALAPCGAGDRELLTLAASEGRRILTRDRRLAERAGGLGRWLAADSVMGQADELAHAEPIDWRTGRYTRCLMDNAPLRPASADELAGIPESARSGGGPFRRCPVCGRVYWPGSHVRRLDERLDRLAEIALTSRASPRTARNS
jgi:uncharacterized protein with PIN domain